jgi:hypothetical protein
MFAFLRLRRDKPPAFNYKETKMKEILGKKMSAIAEVPPNSTLVLFAAVVDGTPTEAQIEMARHTVAVNLENVGATATSAYLTRFEPVSLSHNEALLLNVESSLTKFSSDVVDPEASEA